MKKGWKLVMSVLLWGGLWGITEATVGCVLHLLPLKAYGWLFWYPIVFFFMDRAYRSTGSSAAILAVAALSAGIKMLNLLLPIRVDMVLNPSISILLEGLALFVGLTAVRRVPGKLWQKGLFALGINTGWRVLYLLYILCMPQWMIDISALRGWGPFLEFMAVQNLLTSCILVGLMLIPVEQGKLARTARDWVGRSRFQGKEALLQAGGVALALALNIVLQFTL